MSLSAECAAALLALRYHCLSNYRKLPSRDAHYNTTEETTISQSLLDLEFYELPCDEEWEIDRSLLTIREQLGEGAFGLVMRADAVELPDMPTTNSVAVKMLKGKVYLKCYYNVKVPEQFSSKTRLAFFFVRPFFFF